MNRQILALVAMALAPLRAYAIDGLTLINQSTVMAAGGFPYIISQPGSYKLSGNLSMSTSARSNYPGMDVAILIASNNVTLDLNGFSIVVTDLLGASLGHPFYGIAESGAFSQITIANGAVRVATNTNLVTLTAINMPLRR